MKAGSVIVDLVAENGGNCEITRPGERVQENGVTVIGELNLPSTIPYHASQMYAKNIATFLQNLVKDGEIRMNVEDPIISESPLVHDGEVVSVRVRELLGLPIDISAKGRRSDN